MTPTQLIEEVQTFITSKSEKEKLKQILELQSIIATVLRVTKCDVTNRSQKRDNADALKIYSYMARRFTKNTYHTIGKVVNRNHATIICAYKAFFTIYKTENNFRELTDSCVSKHQDELGMEDRPKEIMLHEIKDDLIKCSIDELKRIKNWIKLKYVSKNG